MITSEAASLSTRNASAAERRRGRWIDHWVPEDDTFWRTKGQAIARKNLALSIVADHIGFCVWMVWTVVVINLGNAGIELSLSQQFLLTLIPNLVGSLLRVPYTFAVPRFGGRAWTALSSLVLLVPALLLAVVVPSRWLAHQSHGTQFWLLLLCAATAGFGGANFASSMANISFFYPERTKGYALGLNAAGGNLGVAVGQLTVPLVIIIGVPAAAVKLSSHQVHLAYAGWIWVPGIVATAALAWRHMDSLTQAKSDKQSYVSAIREPHTWVLSTLYVGTFGSFIGYSFALPLVIRNGFPSFLQHHPFIATYLAGLGFLGALVGSLSRPLGGRLSDRFGGAQVTVAMFAGMALFTGAAIAAVEAHNFALFLTAFVAIFLFTGMGNGAIYKLIPSVFMTEGMMSSPPEERTTLPLELKRRAAAAIGIAGAIGALGGVGVQVVLRQASLHVSALEAAAKTPAAKAAVAAAHSAWPAPALWAFLASYVVLGAATSAIYLYRMPRTALVVAAA